VEDQKQITLFKCLISAFIYFDGVPKEVKSDNQKACVDRWEYGRPVFNKKLLEFASHYRFKPLAITPGKPVENLYVKFIVM
jgi:transposase